MKRIILFLMSLIMIAGCVSCGSEKASEEVKSTIDNFFTAVKSYDTEGLNKFFKSDDEIRNAQIIDKSTPQYEYLKDKAPEITYEISNVKVKGSKASANLKVSYLNMTATYSAMIKKAILIMDEKNITTDATGEVFTDLMKEAFNKALATAAPRKETVAVPVKLNKSDGKWYIKGDDKISDIVTGNLASTLTQLTSDIDDK